ncbi:MAG TPA: hypothetical protein PJ982_07090, partial [Lacipirellulaceae bacterium]|nr:hypothetical protein [Lacipirellulaceae bacterium]
GPACSSQESPARGQDQTPPPSNRDLRDLAKGISPATQAAIVDVAAQQRREPWSPFSISGFYCPSLFAQHTCLRV